jgi:glutamate dehydrogenase (NADP+)
MPSTLGSRGRLPKGGILFAPGKASNAGGVATSGLEMSQNAMRLSWSREEVAAPARDHHARHPRRCEPARHGARQGSVNYVDGANIAGFVKVADAMIAQGVGVIVSFQQIDTVASGDAA